MKFMSVPTLVLCALAAVTLVAQSPMRPGRWETTMQMQMPNLPVQMPATKTSSCVTAEQLKKDPAAGLPSGPNANSNQCKASDYKYSDNTVTWKMVCSGQQAMTANGEMTFMGDSFTGTMKMSTPQGEMAMQLSGKRTGDCTQ